MVEILEKVETIRKTRANIVCSGEVFALRVRCNLAGSRPGL
jgi:hypothetical protein